MINICILYIFGIYCIPVICIFYIHLYNILLVIEFHSWKTFSVRTSCEKSIEQTTWLTSEVLTGNETFSSSHFYPLTPTPPLLNYKMYTKGFCLTGKKNKESGRVKKSVHSNWRVKGLSIMHEHIKWKSAASKRPRLHCHSTAARLGVGQLRGGFTLYLL